MDGRIHALLKLDGACTCGRRDTSPTRKTGTFDDFHNSRITVTYTDEVEGLVPVETEIQARPRKPDQVSIFTKAVTWFCGKSHVQCIV